MSPVHRRTLLKSGAGLAVTTLAGCLQSIRCRGEGGEPLPDPHRIVVGEVTDDPATRFPIELAAEFDDTNIATDDPARLSASLRNTGADPVTIEADPPWPFGVPFLIRKDTDDFQRITAWNDAMADSDHLSTCDRSVESWEEVFIRKDLEAGATVSETFEIYIDSPAIAAGTYWSFISARAKNDHTAESHKIRFDEITIEPLDG